ncbi:MAG: hypothetical protein ACE5ES_04190 [Candidatus Nanoarchaeia archaeon]
MNKSKSFEEHISTNNKNFEILTKEFPKTIIAAEFINDLFDQIFGNRFTHDNQILWQYSVAQMLFGIHYCWLNYFIQTAQGYNDVGLMIGRRAIEYACYISKIVGREKYAILWNEKTVDKSKLNKFSAKFAVPQKYFASKYDHLNSLLVFHDYASEFGVHGNHTTLISKFRDAKYRNKISMSFQDNPKGIPHSCGVSIQIGSFIIDALLHDLKENIRDYDDFIKLVSIKKQIVSDAVIEAIKFTDGNVITKELLNSINNEDNSELISMYNELKAKYVVT